MNPLPSPPHLPLEMIREARVLAVLDTMWGEAGEAPRWFDINPMNHTGRRLYWFTDIKWPALWVTNICPQQVESADLLGSPDPEWLRYSLDMLCATRLQSVPLLVCGSRSRRAYKASGYHHGATVHFMKHPAARDWTKTELEATRSLLTLGG